MLPLEIQERFLQQAFSLWITPEIERRRDRGILPDGFELFAAQVVMWPDGSPLDVRFNEEVRCSFIVRLAHEIACEQNKLIGTSDIDQVAEIRPPSDEADAAHITLLRRKESWCFTFDFTYNNARIASIYTAAQQFLATAFEAMEAGRYRPSVDNLFSAVELMSTSLLLSQPGRENVKLNHNRIRVR